ncbi:response regulator transcription factor [Quadrisphaera oryzae]|uniref:response regulator transcription factor n=1 Tax=Quadrisphaera TaxID=317661 RepID=UPI0016473D43|nr:response regulator transcription factor [Quadrisphaera sp. RL12-1S]MBC3760933.1 response regulator transcription factor [Quadrisphaera sp. RL12-1S]
MTQQTPPGARRAQVVVVEDEPAIAGAVAARLRADGHDVTLAGDGPSGVALCRSVRPDLVVLDLMLPGFDGYEVCRRIQSGPDPLHAAVLMLTARDDEADLVLGLRLGADDYLTKPFSPRELSARAAALLRRAARTTAPAPVPDPAPVALRLGDVTVDVESRLVHRGGGAVHLTPTEFDLLVRLAERPGAVISREQLLTDVWGWRDLAVSRAESTTTTRTVDSHVAALRRKLGDDVVRTVHGVGYAGALPVTPA